MVLVRILLTYDADKPLAAGDVNPLASRIVEHIVGIACAPEICDNFAGVAVEHKDAWRRARGHTPVEVCAGSSRSTSPSFHHPIRVVFWCAFRRCRG